MAATPYFTVFTPTYNEGKNLHRVFQSIENQEFRDFEWIIVNDGSSDNSDALIREFVNNHPEIEIKYILQENAGKHVAWNNAVTMGRGTLFVPADGDDYFVAETLSFFYEKWTSLTPEERSALSGINVLCYDNDLDSIVGTPFAADGLKTNNVELEFRYKIQGEKWGCIRLDILKRRLFPVMKNTHYPESYLWFYFAKHYEVICFNKPLRRYYTSPTGIIQSEKHHKTLNNAKVMLSYDFWVLKNFGFYIARFNPGYIIQLLKEVLSSLLVIMTTSQ